MFSVAFMVPLALIYERKTRPKLTGVVLFQAFLSGFFGVALAQNLNILDFALTSPTYLVAISNLSAAITFLVALCFRQEKLNTGFSGIVKMAGTVVEIGGTMLFTFYRGPVFTIWSTHIDLLRQYHNSSNFSSSSSHMNNPVLGFLAGFGSILCFSIWLIIQGKMSKRYPCPYSSTALICIMGSIQTIAFALCVERDWKQWKMGWDIKLLTAAYAGIVVSGVSMVSMSWCVQKRGPLFVSSFNPLALLMVALASSLLLDEKFSLGSVSGGVLIVCGLYMVLWGKSKESSSSSSQLRLPSSAIAPNYSESIECVRVSVG